LSYISATIRQHYTIAYSKLPSLDHPSLSGQTSYCHGEAFVNTSDKLLLLRQLSLVNRLWFCLSDSLM